ncbi:hypothetical protein [Staphylococcus sp. 47.1]|uniref:hypothetical protein n=1 Tax=Staphylococcus sp. 47.1 TaxID=1929484 RepID=UPI00114EE99E
MEVDSKLINTEKQGHVQEVAQTDNVLKTEKITSIKFHSYQDVYNMEVENHHNYSVEGGFIIHNCVDSLRYSVERFYRPDKKRNPTIKKSIKNIKSMGL